MDLLEVLGDIELAQEMMKESEQENSVGLVDHVLDINYKKLMNKLVPLDKKSKEYQIIERYMKMTSTSNRAKIVDIYSLEREGEKKRFGKYSNLKNRKLLWHGTNVAVMAAILSKGLRIMPHSGGRVGRGIYFASENSKSFGYVRPSGKTGLMLLCEIPLGNPYSITKDDSLLVKPPSGYDSVIAQGRTEPDPTKETTIVGDFGEVVVPQGKPLNRSEYYHSSFFQSEYLVYDEAQVLLRYLVELNLS